MEAKVRITSRQITLSLLGLFFVATLLVMLIDIGSGTATSLTVIDGIAALLFAGLFWAAWHSWAYTPYVLVIIVTMLVGGALEEPYITQEFSGMLLIPSIVALVLTNERWILGSAAAALGAMLMRADWQGVYTEPMTLIVFAIIIGGLVLGRMVAAGATYRATVAQSQAEAAALALREANAGLELRIGERTATLQATLEEVQAARNLLADQLEVIQQQREALQALSVPVLPVSTTTLVIPLIGALDSARLLQLQAQALGRLEQSGARNLLLDVTGVQLVDSQVAQGFMRVVRAAQLLGAETILVGVRPEIAQTMVELGLDLSSVRAFSTIQAALAHTGGHAHLR